MSFMCVCVFQGSCPTCRGTRLALNFLLPSPDLLCPPTLHRGAHCTLAWVPTHRVAPQALMDLKEHRMYTKVRVCLPKWAKEPLLEHILKTVQWCNYTETIAIFWWLAYVLHMNWTSSLRQWLLTRLVSKVASYAKFKWIWTWHHTTSLDVSWSGIMH